MKGVWSIGGMVLAGENQSTWGKNLPTATLSTTYSTWTDLRADPGFCGERLGR